jgi:hypothetical protein
MLFTNPLTYTIAVAATLPAIVSAYTYNDQTKLYHIGEVNMDGSRAAEWMGLCGGSDIPAGDYACGLFGPNGTKDTAIYKCTYWPADGNYYLKRAEVCLWAGTGYGGQCSRNQRRKGKKFYPFVDGKKAVCVTTEMLLS